MTKNDSGRTAFAWQIRSGSGWVGPFLPDKNGPGRTAFAWVGPFLSVKNGPTRTVFVGQKRSGGPILPRTVFAVTGPIHNCYYGPVMVGFVRASRQESNLRARTGPEMPFNSLLPTKKQY